MKPLILRRKYGTARLIGSSLLVLLTVVISPDPAVAQTALTSGEIDIELEFDGADFEVVLVDTTSGTEFEPDNAFFFGGPSSVQVVPDDPAFSFLGQSDSLFHLFPQIEDPTLPFIGLATDELPAGTFVGDGITLSLGAVKGPGHFALYQTDSFGTPTVFYNTRDGIDASDSLFQSVGIDDHFNWAFSEPDDYSVFVVRLRGADRRRISRERSRSASVPGRAGTCHLDLRRSGWFGDHAGAPSGHASRRAPTSDRPGEFARRVR